MKLVFATMIRAAERWCRVSISDLERHQLKLLRAELGTRPAAGEQRHARPTDARTSPHDQPGHRFTGRSGLDPPNAPASSNDLAELWQHISVLSC